ncbi:stalk domain-containing protein [Paenibacillus puldeungensis]|uniref:Stalk domain-containing protein n=1 Tax=Paenibacillus puldeungensis TaxID=696536 RepID=A0ABW3S2D1_9BACL
MNNGKVLGMLLASAIITSSVAVGSASAAPASQPRAKAAPVKASVSKLKVVNQSVTINGSKLTLKSVVVSKVTLFSLRDLAKGLGASIKKNGADLVVEDNTGMHKLTLKVGSKGYRAEGSQDGTATQFIVAPQSVEGSVYVEPVAVVNALGGEVSETGEISSTARLSGQFSTPFFDASGSVIVSKDDAETPQLVKLSANGNHEVFTSNENANSAVLSPDGAWGAFTDENGALFLINTANGTVKTLSTDGSVKTDLVWSADGKKIYFIQGDKQEKISYITLDTGKVTEVLADKVENKSEVQVSADEKKIAYFVNVTGKAETDKDSTEDALKIDYSKAGTQVFSLDLSAKDAKPVQLTKELDNKLYLSLLSDGRVTYVSADPDGKVENSILKVISVDGTKIDNLVSDIDVVSSEVISGKQIILADTADGSYKLIEINATGAKTELFSTKLTVSEWAVSPSGAIALIADGKVVLVQGGKSLELTK